MPIEIRTFRGKRGALRVDLIRREPQEGSETNKFKRHQIGSFLVKDGRPNELNNTLLPEEALQVDHWLAEAEFAKLFAEEADHLHRSFLRIPQKLQNALVILHGQAQALGLEFNPHKIMLNTLLTYAKKTQHKIEQLTNQPLDLLHQAIDLENESSRETEAHKNVLQESRSLFKTLLQLGQPLGKICSLLENASKTYGKSKNIPPAQLREWAGDMINRNPNKPIPRWACMVAIDVLQSLHIDVKKIATLPYLTEVWTLQNGKAFSINDALKTFLLKFKIPQIDEPLVKDIIKKIYGDPKKWIDTSKEKN